MLQLLRKGKIAKFFNPKPYFASLYIHDSSWRECIKFLVLTLKCSWAFEACEGLCKTVTHFNWKLWGSSQVVELPTMKVASNHYKTTYENEFLFLPLNQLLFPWSPMFFWASHLLIGYNNKPQSLMNSCVFSSCVVSLFGLCLIWPQWVSQGN